MAESHEPFSFAEGKYLEGVPLQAQELACMEQSLASGNVRRMCIACGALLRDPGSSQSQKQEARKILESLCKSLNKDSDKTELTITCLLIPFVEISTLPVKEFIYGLLNLSPFTLRANAISILERLGSRGDERALALLRFALNDPNDVVRQSASAVLKRLEPD